MLDNHILVADPEEDVLEMMRERMYGYIFPNMPRTEEEKAVFEKACLYQYAHDMTALQKTGEGIPEGLVSFRIGDFQMAFDSGTMESRLTSKSICPSARGLLLRHGLLYRGVEGRGLYGPD